GIHREFDKMQSAGKIAFSMCVLISAVATASTGSAKLRRDGVLNLYPFPRVGRAHDTWQVPINDDSLDVDFASKRQLYVFPRVGRSEYGGRPDLNGLNLRLAEILLGQPRSHEYVKRESESNGMWFGPRVGRSFSYNDDNGRFEENGRGAPEEIETEHVDREKRQTKLA
ncbi:unnamed protein product, partial [Iphiclides podalirius]